MADEIKTLSAELARDPQSLVFLRLGDLLRQRGQLDAAHRVALNGLERHPHLADAHDLYARILADKRDYERAFDEWDMARRIAPGHMGARRRGCCCSTPRAACWAGRYATGTAPM